MDPVLHKVLMELDRQSIDLDHYFNWTEDEKLELVSFIGRLLQPYIKKSEIHKHFLMTNICRIIQEAEIEEEYEQADILNRCLNKIEEGYW